MSKLLDSLVPFFPWIVIGVILALGTAAVVLFKKLSKSREEAERTRIALELELSFFRRLFMLVPVVGKYFAPAPASSLPSQNDATISRPIPAVPDPRAGRSITEPPPERP